MEISESYFSASARFLFNSIILSRSSAACSKFRSAAAWRICFSSCWIRFFNSLGLMDSGSFESRAYLCMHEFEKTGKDPGKTRLEHSQIFVDFEENKKKRSFKRKMVLGITPNTKFVYSLKPCCSHAPGFLFI